MIKLIYIVILIAGAMTGYTGEVSKTIQLDKRQNLLQYIGKEITVSGTALNAKLGAVVIGKCDVVYVKDLDSWPENLYNQNVLVTGKLLKKEWGAFKPLVARPTGRTYFIENYKVRSEVKNRGSK